MPHRLGPASFRSFLDDGWLVGEPFVAESFVLIREISSELRVRGEREGLSRQ